MSQYVLFIIAAALLFALYIFWRTKDLFHPMVIFPVAYVYFTLGPVVTYVRGGRIYEGIVQSKIDDAVLVFLLALLGLFFSCVKLLNFSAMSWDIRMTDNQKRLCFWFLTLFATLTNLISFAFVLPNLGIVLGGVKGALLRAIPFYGFWHFNYLLFWTIAIAMILALDYWRSSRFALLNVAAYCLYCMLMHERDFVLAFLAVLAYRTSKQKMSKVFSILLVAGSLVVFVGLFALRSNVAGVDTLDLYLGQGNNLNIITNVMKWMDEWLQPSFGWTYIQSTINLLPSFIYRQGVPLVDWFKNEFAAGSDSGYGFSLEGEAFMNFGYPGVFVFFFLFGKVLLFFYHSKQRDTLFGCFMYYFALIFGVYALRGDSLMLFKGFSYAMGFFFFVLFLANRGFISIYRL